MNRQLMTALGIAAAAMIGSAHVAHAQIALGDVDRSATLRFSYVGAPAAYDPPFSKNRYQETAFMLPVYDMLVRFDHNGDIVPSLATSWKFSDNGATLTMQLRAGVKFTDGSDVNAAAVVRSLTRTRNDPNSLLAGQIGSIASAEAGGPSIVVIHLNNPDANVLYRLATSAGMIVSAQALDKGVNLGATPVGSGPYRLVSSGPQGANFERNEDYFDKSANQFAKVSIVPIVDVTARLNALQTGQIDAGLFQSDQWPQIDRMVKTGKFTVYSVLGPNSLPLWLNTKVKPLDNPKVRLALAMAIDREAISQGILNGRCEPAAQPLQPGVIGHDPSLKAYKRDVAKAKALLQEAGVGPFS
ncbi:MAG: ABC transporter substrate-binding protein, partial [Betaproteobacteria bacterium]